MMLFTCSKLTAVTPERRLNNCPKPIIKTLKQCQIAEIPVGNYKIAPVVMNKTVSKKYRVMSSSSMRKTRFFKKKILA